MMRATRLALIALLAWGSLACAQFWIGEVTGNTTETIIKCNDDQEAFIGNLAEAGIWPIAFSTAQITAMCHNQFAYWGTSVSC